MTKKRFNPYLDDERIEWLKKEAKRLSVGISELLRRIIDEYRKGEK